MSSSLLGSQLTALTFARSPGSLLPGQCYQRVVGETLRDTLVKVVQPLVFDEYGVPIHPADLAIPLAVGTLVKVTVTLDMLGSRRVL
jgi:hypothetical protein